MDVDPDYKSYTLQELHDVANRIDRAQYPEQYKRVLAQIKARERAWAENRSPHVASGDWGDSCLRGCGGSFAGAVFGIAIALVWLTLFPPPHVPNMDGMNQWGGHMGLIFLGIVAGGVIGPFVARGKRAWPTLGFAIGIFLLLATISTLRDMMGGPMP